MKKLFGLSILGIFMLTGCGAGATDTMSCTYETAGNTVTTKMTYKIDYEGTEVKKLRVTYDYHQDTDNNMTTDDMTNDNTDNNGTNNDIDGVGTGTDGTTNDTQFDNDGIIDGIVGSSIDSIIAGVADTILDISGLRDRHTTVQNTYGNIPGFSVQNTSDTTDNNYRVTYVIDYDTISDDDLATLNLSRDIDTLRSNYTSQGFTCAE